MASKVYLVTAALVSPYGADDRIRYYYRGSELTSDGLRDGEVERLEAAGLIKAQADVDEFLQPAVGVPPHEPVGDVVVAESEERHASSRRSASSK